MSPTIVRMKIASSHTSTVWLKKRLRNGSWVLREQDLLDQRIEVEHDDGRIIRGGDALDDRLEAGAPRASGAVFIHVEHANVRDFLDDQSHQSLAVPYEQNRSVARRSARRIES